MDRRVVVLLLLGLGLAVWALRSGSSGDEEAALLPGEEPAPTAESSGPLLDGSSTEQPMNDAPPAPTTDAATREDAPDAQWVLTFEAQDEQGEPLDWVAAHLFDKQGEVLQEHFWEGPESEARLVVSGGAYLVLRSRGSPQRPRWRSDWLEPPVSGSRHIVARMGSGLRVAGTVFHPDGKTVYSGGAARISASGSPMTDTSWRPGTQRYCVIDKEGRFEADGLPPGPVSIEVDPHQLPHGRKTRFEAKAGAENLALVLKAGGAYRYIIRDARTGKAPATTRLRVMRITRDGEELASSGAWNTPPTELEAQPSRWIKVRAGSVHRMRVLALGYKPGDAITIRIPEEGGAVEVPIELTPDENHVAHLIVRVRHDLQEPLAWIRIARATSPRGRDLSGVRLQNGELHFRLFAGPYDIRIGQAMAPKPDTPSSWFVGTRLRGELSWGARHVVDVHLVRGGWIFVPEAVVKKLAWTALLQRGSDTQEHLVQRGSWGEPKVAGHFIGPVLPGTWELTVTPQHEDTPLDPVRVETRVGDVAVLGADAFKRADKAEADD